MSCTHGIELVEFPEAPHPAAGRCLLVAGVNALVIAHADDKRVTALFSKVKMHNRLKRLTIFETILGGVFMVLAGWQTNGL